MRTSPLLPAAFLRRGRRAGTSTVAVCVGDSITRGGVSTDWVGQVQRRLRPSGIELVNAGADGNFAWNVLQRLDDVVRCRPDVVTLLIGTNDVQATASPAMEQMYRRQQRITQTPSLEWYLENVDAVLARLTDETGARIAVMTIPPLGEDPDSVMNRRVDRYNDALRELVDGRGLEVLPLHDRVTALMPVGHRPPPYLARSSPVILAALRHSLLRRPWNEISRANGLTVLTDHVHLNDRAGAAVADLVAPFISGTGTA